MAVPSVRSPVLVTFTPPGTASRTAVTVFTGQGAGVYLVFSILTFQVPRELSAPKAAAAELIAKTIRAKLKILRMGTLLEIELTVHSGDSQNLGAFCMPVKPEVERLAAAIFRQALR